jgi:hypothetical protein
LDPSLASFDQAEQERLIAFESLEKIVRDQLRILNDKAITAKNRGDKGRALSFSLFFM